ncbi:MAG: hypothetical protein JSR59_05065 [Proteobacteria bacterium]|nr:hypothetical protein [Pseudomonadota bacterium]
MTGRTAIPWIDRFVVRLAGLGMPASIDELQRLAWELYPDLHEVAPEEVAELEWREAAQRRCH